MGGRREAAEELVLRAAGGSDDMMGAISEMGSLLGEEFEAFQAQCGIQTETALVLGPAFLYPDWLQGGGAQTNRDGVEQSRSERSSTG